METTAPAEQTDSVSTNDQRPAFAAVGVGVVILVKLALMLSCITQYGYFRDELYYLACSEHLSWGYVDQPPLVVAIVWAVRHTLGSSLFAIRLLPALAGCGSILLAALIAREMGGRRVAQVIAALGVLSAGVFLIMDHLITMNAFDPLFWMACAFIVLRIQKTGNERLWLLFGVISGFALLNKYSIGFFAVGIVAGLLLTPMRKSLARPWIWIGGVIATAIFLPNFLWQMHRDFPFLQLMHHIRQSGRDVSFGPIGFIAQQILMLGPLAAPALFTGVAWFFTRRGKPYRVLGWAYLVTLIEMIVLKGKNYYLAPIYPMIFAAAGVALEQWSAGKVRPWRSRTVVAYVSLWMLSFVLLLPIALPVLPVETYIRYTKALHIEVPKFENQPQGRLPQIYADMFGWPEMAQTVAQYYNSLPPGERQKTAIYGNNYGDLSAIDFFGPRYGLPKPIGAHQTYWFWGPRQYTGESIILLGEDDPTSLRQHCASLTTVAELHDPLARPDENLPIYHCRGLDTTLQALWPRLKKFD